MTTIKPIETVYNGYRFRSRLEARWAVFFDALGITYKIDNDWRDYDLSPTIDRAFNRARQARFEHGEKGAT